MHNDPITPHVPIRIALIFGGQSSEHGVSCLTAASVLNALDERFEAIPIGITRQGQWTQVDPEVVSAYRIIDGQPPQVKSAEHDALLCTGKNGCQVATRVDDRLVDVRGIDVAFTLLHGPFGEDGTVQGMLEMMGIPYVGCGVTASAIGMDKHYMRLAFEAADLPVCPYEVITDHQWRFHRDDALHRIGQLEFPLFVKPARAGSSIGITRVTDLEAVVTAVDEARRHDPKVIVEQGVVGRELECAVLGDPDSPEGCLASGLGEVRVLREDAFYDYQTKYFDTADAALEIPADVPEDIVERVQDIAKRAFRALGCEGLARVDVFLTEDLQIYVNEGNTMPGFTEISMFPSLWQAAGVDYSQLVARLVDLALTRKVGLR